MHLIFSKADLVALINKLQNIVPAKPLLPILSHVLVETLPEGGAIFTATDLTVSIQVRINAEVVSEGSAVLPARAFFSLVKELPPLPLELSLQAQGVQIVCGASRFKLHAMKKEEFPPFAKMPEGSLEWNLLQKDLKEAFFQTSFAVAREESRQVITGLDLFIEKGVATFTGTDGKKLARKQLQVSDAAGVWRGILPIKAVDELYKLMQSDDAPLQILLAGDKIAAKSEGEVLVTKLMPGEYPDLNSVIPANSPYQALLDREELMSLLRQISLFMTDQYPSARFAFEAGQLALSSNQTDVGEAQVVMPVEGIEGAIQIAFNPHALLDILKHTKGEKIALGLSDPYNPGVIRESDATLFVLMPMRLAS